MKKRLFAFLLIFSLILVVTPSVYAADTAVAKPTSSTVLINGESVVFDAYNIDGSNYFKLRDLAYTLDGTERQFEVLWDSASNAISLTRGRSYTAIGGEMTGKSERDKTALPIRSKVYVDGIEIMFTAFNIEGNNYFKLREIGIMHNIGIEWIGADDTIVIDTTKDYMPQFDHPFESYVNELLGFSIELPVGDIFGVEENSESGEFNTGGITVFYIASRDAGESGTMFYIIRWSGVWSDEDRPIQAGGHAILGLTDEYTFILHTPSGVEFDEHDPLSYEQSRWIYNNLEKIIDSFELTDGKAL